MKNMKKMFRDMCRGEYDELNEVAVKAAKEHKYSITLDSKNVLIEAENPRNVNGIIRRKLEYKSGIVDKIYAIFNELDDILFTMYQPLYLAMLPTIVASLGGVIRELTHDEREVVIVYTDGRESEPYKYNSTDYGRFVDHITDLIVSTAAVLTVPDQTPCKNHKEHCGKCGNSDCRYNAGLIKSLWHNLEPSAQQQLKNTLDKDKLAALEKAIG